MIKLFDDIIEIKVLAGGETKPFRYQTANVRFHKQVGFVTDYKTGCGEILKLFVGKKLYNSAQSIHMNKDRQNKINNTEPYLGDFLKNETITAENIDVLLNYVVEYDVQDYGCGTITNVFLRIPNSRVNKNINIGFNIGGHITTIYSTDLNNVSRQSNDSDYLYNYANSNILYSANSYKSTGEISNKFMGKLISLFDKRTIINIRDTQLHEPYRTKFDEKYKEMSNMTKLNGVMFEF